MSGLAPAAPSTPATLALLGEVVDLKRVRVAGTSVATTGFARAWQDVAAGEDPGRVARREAALALAATRLGAIDAQVLRGAGLEDDAIADVLRGAAADAGASEDLLAALARTSGGAEHRSTVDPPAFVARLAAQPRAGVTAPGRARYVLEPAESHAEHCYATAVIAVLLCAGEGAEPGAPFLAGLAHHLHNAALPDAGFAGETALGEHLGPVVEALTRQALGQLPTPSIRAAVRAALGLVGQVDTPEARAFNAADVLDRVLELRWHERSSAFTLQTAVEDYEIVHEGPLQAFGLAVLDRWQLR